MGSIKLIIEYNNKTNESSSKLEKKGTVSIPEIIGVLESMKFAFIKDTTNPIERSHHEQMEERSKSTGTGSN